MDAPEVNLLTEQETILALQMVNDRNLTVHAYNEKIALQIFANVGEYFNLLYK